MKLTIFLGFLTRDDGLISGKPAVLGLLLLGVLALILYLNRKDVFPDE